MLSSDQVNYISSRFNVYEHNWAFYEEILGEGILIDDVLSYCDGAGLYLPAFSLKSPGHSFEPGQIHTYLNRAAEHFPNVNLKFINIWGQFDTLPPVYKRAQGSEFNLCEQSDYYTDAFDSVFDLEEFNKNMPSSARRRLKALDNKAMQTGIQKAVSFTHEHFSIIEQWMKNHTVSIVHKEFFYALRSYIHKDGVYLCEVRSQGALVGLSILALVGNRRMVVLNSFPMRGDGLRAGDALFAAAIGFAREKSVRWIHRGYSASDSLLQAKESWGSMTRSQPYREAFYVRDADAAKMVSEGKFLWRLRLAG